MLGRAFMSRFIRNRHWTLIFALGVCLSFSTLTPRHAVADPSMGTTEDDNGGGGGTTGIGDPDVPDGTGKSRLAKSGVLGRGNSNLGIRVAGDDRSSGSVVMWRLYVAWLGYRSFWFRY